MFRDTVTDLTKFADNTRNNFQFPDGCFTITFSADELTSMDKIQFKMYRVMSEENTFGDLRRRHLSLVSFPYLIKQQLIGYVKGH